MRILCWGDNMSYRLHYENDIIVDPIRESSRKVFGIKSVLIIILSLIAAISIWQHRTVIVDCLIPGNDAVTVAAFDGLIDNLEEGTDFKTSFLAFCREIIDNAQIS